MEFHFSGKECANEVDIQGSGQPDEAHLHTHNRMLLTDKRKRSVATVEQALQ